MPASEFEQLIGDLEAIDTYLDQGVLDLVAAQGDPAVDNDVLTEFAAGMTVVGGQVNGDSTEVDALAAEMNAVFEAAMGESLAANCNGTNGYAGFYPRVFLDSCNATALSNGLWTGVGVATLAAWLVGWTGIGGAFAAAFAAGLTIYAGLTGLCNSWNTGITLTATPPIGLAPPVLFCYSQ